MRNYSEKERANAVVYAVANGYPHRRGALTRTARQFNIPKTTLSGWARGASNTPPPDALRDSQQELLEAIEHELVAIFEAMDGKRPAASYLDLVTAAGILIDKLHLLDNGGVERLEAVLRVIFED